MRLLIALVLVIAAPWPCPAQTLDAASPAASMSAAEMEKFLLTARIVKRKESSKGVTNAYRVTLSDGVFTHDAQIQNVDIEKPFFDVGPRHSEVNFRDSYRFNIAAYRLSLLLGLDNVPMSVERVIDGRPAAVTWWLDNVMDDSDRRRKKIGNTNPLRAADYYSIMFVFDELIQNRDRNQGNIMWTPDSRMWMIDHTRAFRTGKDLLKAENLTRIERNLWKALRALDRQAVTEAVGKALTRNELDALFARRDRIVQHFDQRIAALGEDKVVYTVR
nr:hypothetical protein [uncultured bacterium]